MLIYQFNYQTISPFQPSHLIASPRQAWKDTTTCLLAPPAPHPSSVRQGHHHPYHNTYIHTPHAACSLTQTTRYARRFHHRRPRIAAAAAAAAAVHLPSPACLVRPRHCFRAAPTRVADPQRGRILLHHPPTRSIYLRTHSFTLHFTHT